MAANDTTSNPDQSFEKDHSKDTESRIKFPENTPGKYYVLKCCNACGLCKSIAEELFDFDNEGTYYYIARQPSTPEEQALMDEAIEFCTANGIWWDGRDNQLKS